MKRLISAILLALATSAVTYAASMTAQSGVYLIGQGGWSFVDAPSPLLGVYVPWVTPLYSQTSDTYALGGGLGYDFALSSHLMVGAEVSYFDLGETDYQYNLQPIFINASGSGSIKNSGTQVLLTTTYIMSDGLAIMAKAGAMHETTQVSFTGTFPFSVEKEGALPVLGIGFGYQLVPNLMISAQYEHVFGSDWNNDAFLQQTPSEPMTQDIVSAGLSYKFPL